MSWMLRRSRTSFVAFVCGVLASWHVASPAETPQSACEPVGPVAEVLGEIRAIDGSCDHEPGCREQKLKLLEEALRHFPDDVQLHRAFQDASRVAPADSAGQHLEERYRSHLEAHPASAPYLYLYGRSLSYAGRREEAFETMQKSIDADPDFPWGHSGVLLDYLDPQGKHWNEAKARAHVEAFTRLCPTTPDVFVYALRLEDTEFVRRKAETLRVLLEESTRHNPLAWFPYYRVLWAAEFRLSRPSQHDIIRSRVQADVARILALDLQDNRQWWQILQHGYDLAGDLPAKRNAMHQMVRRFACSFESVQAYWQAWEKESPRPTVSLDAPEWQSYYRGLYEKSATWVAQCPGNALSQFLRFDAALSLNDLPTLELESEIDTFLRLLEQIANTVSVSPSPYLRAAKAYVDRGIRFDRIPELARKGMAEATHKYARRAASGDEALKKRAQEDLDHHQWESFSLVAAADIELGRLTEVRVTLEGMKSFLNEKSPGGEAAGPEATTWSQRHGTYWRRLGALAEKEDRKADALGFYTKSLRYFPRHPETERAVEKVWRELGGTPAGLNAWSDVAPTVSLVTEATEASPWTVKDQKLAPFHAPDLVGNVWTLDDLKGRTALINVWATWCGPCKRELPYIRMLHDKLSGRDEFLVVTFNIDENPGVVLPFVKEEGVTVPVLLASDILRRMLAEIMIPRTWVVDRAGIVRWESIGFGLEGERWMVEVLKLMESTSHR